MKKNVILLLLLWFQATLFTSAQAPRKLKRSEGFWGLHFDFHAGLQDERVGETLTEGMLDTLIRATRPDYIQIDCKGHAGVTSYPTKVGSPVKSFTQDPLQLWRKVTAKHGVALVMHYSGVWDADAVKNHPHWARLDAEGKRDDRLTSPFSAYKDSLLLAQLREVSDYGVDGAWVDGDCWAIRPDYSPAAVAAFRQATGFQEAPKTEKDPHWFEWMQFHRNAFKNYVRHYVEGIHRHNPAFQITSNWAYSSMMPEAVDVPVDYLSGDVAAANGVLSAAFQARCLARQGKPWDLMAWGFSHDFANGFNAAKSTRQLQQEAAQVLAMGGGFQVYFQQNRDASIKRWNVPVAAEVAKFCRERQFLHHAEVVPQIALLYSTAAIQRSSKNLFSPTDAELAGLKGILTALLDAQQSVEVLSEHHLRGQMDRYPLIVVPEWNFLEPAFKAELTEYARNGGKLLVIGKETVRLFEQELAVTLTGETVKAPCYLSVDGTRNQERLTGANAEAAVFRPLANTVTLGQVYGSPDVRSGRGPVLSVATLGKGQVAGLYLNVGETYLNHRSHDLRDILHTVVRRLFTKPVVEVVGSHLVHVVTARKEGKLLVNILNVAGGHDAKNTFAYDEIPALHGLTVRIRTSKKPTRVTLLPENRVLTFRSDTDGVTVTLPPLALHTVLRIE
ncbi:MAG: hypothetical protein LH606_16190 [Cytophagaceae bacterium]|nr:hypothetical protein [Cytophagaceae bacterium]